MAYITKYIGDKVRPYSSYITIAWLALLFFSLGIVYYYLYFKNSKYNPTNKENKFTDVANIQKEEDDPQFKTVNLYICKVDWCSHCKKAESIFKAFQDKYNNKVINNKRFIISINDLTDTDNAETKDFIKKWNINQYPTVFINDPITGKRYDFKAKVTMENLEKFIQSY